MTADAMVGTREEVLAAGMNDRMATPIDVVEMLATLMRWVRQRLGFSLVFRQIAAPRFNADRHGPAKTPAVLKCFTCNDNLPTR
jgi:hypothetical protein